MPSKIILPIVLVILVLLVGVGVYTAFANLNPLKDTKTNSSQSSVIRSPTNSQLPISPRTSVTKSSQINPYEQQTFIPAVSAPAITPQSPVVNQLNTFSTTDLASHSTEKDCFISVLSKVYNVTVYVDQHPGGRDILKACGKTLDNVKHPGGSFTGPEIQGILKEFYIGELK